MSYSNQNVEIVIDGNGVDDRFGINFYYIEGFTYVIKAELWDYTDPQLPTQITFNLGSDYSIDESGYPNTEVVTTVPVPPDHKIVIYRENQAIQGSSFAEGAFPAQSIEDTYDINMMVSQENRARLDRALIWPPGSPTLSGPDLLALQNQVVINTAGIAALSTGGGFNVISITSGMIPYFASDKELIIINTTSAVTVALPAPLVGQQVIVKVSGDVTSKKIVSPTGIDGFGTDYVLSSLYESVSLVSDGIKWYII